MFCLACFRLKISDQKSRKKVTLKEIGFGKNNEYSDVR